MLVAGVGCGASASDVCEKAAACAGRSKDALETQTCEQKLKLLFDDCKNAGQIYDCLAAQSCAADGSLDVNPCHGLLCTH